MPHSLFEKIWNDHVIARMQDGSNLLRVDRTFLHERTGGVALKSLVEAGRRVRNPRHVFCTMDHIIDTYKGRNDRTTMPGGTEFIHTTRAAATEAGVTLFDIDDPAQGISHVVAAELGIALPGSTLVCADSHTCTLGGMGALAWGIGSSDCEHVLATEAIRTMKPRQMKVEFHGALAAGVTAKDIILHLIGLHGVAGGAGRAIEFTGSAMGELSQEARFTLCNMAVEFSAFTGIIAPDAKTLAYIKDAPYSPSGTAWDAAQDYWQQLHSDKDAVFDEELSIDCRQISPVITWGTSPEYAMAVDGRIPDPAKVADPESRKAMERALQYMALSPGMPIEGLPIDAAFIGSCTNARLSDLRAAAKILKGRKVAAGVKAICVPGSSQVKRKAESEGLHHIFMQAGFEWRESGCSLCFYAGGEGFGYRQRVVTSTNRNFEGRQGRETRSHLASPETVAASAVLGSLADVRKFESR